MGKVVLRRHVVRMPGGHTVEAAGELERRPPVLGAVLIDQRQKNLFLTAHTVVSDAAVSQTFGRPGGKAH